jgi:hypothetical protein
MKNKTVLAKVSVAEPVEIVMGFLVRAQPFSGTATWEWSAVHETDMEAFVAPVLPTVIAQATGAGTPPLEDRVLRRSDVLPDGAEDQPRRYSVAATPFKVDGDKNYFRVKNTIAAHVTESKGTRVKSKVQHFIGVELRIEPDCPADFVQ